MNNVLSEKALIDNLEYLKDILQNFNYSSLSNVIFINIDSFYSYLDTNYKTEDKTISKIMNEIEPYIPLTLCMTDDTLDLFLRAGKAVTTEEIEDLEKSFYKKARMDFMNTIRNAKTDKQWNYILKLCCDLRQCIYN